MPDDSIAAHPGRLASGDSLASVPHVPLDAVLDHPRFAEARNLYLRAFLPLYEGERFLARLLIRPGSASALVLSLWA